MTEALPILARDEADGASMRRLLVERGMVLVSAEAGDREGHALRKIVSELGTAQRHSASGPDVWDIRYDPEVAAQGGARSLTLEPFAFHTDAAFEDPPPRFVAMYVVQEDRHGGGETLLVKSADVLRYLPASTRHVLQTLRYRLHVPAEFDKGVPWRDLPILYGAGLLRYRREIVDQVVCTPEQVATLDELDGAIAASPVIRLQLRSGTILLLDNARILHARTVIFDPTRHLLRMRFAIRELAP